MPSPGAAVHADPGGGDAVSCPDLPGCRTQGEPLEEAAATAEDALHGWPRANAPAASPSRSRTA